MFHMYILNMLMSACKCVACMYLIVLQLCVCVTSAKWHFHHSLPVPPDFIYFCWNKQPVGRQLASDWEWRASYWDRETGEKTKRRGGKTAGICYL